MSRPYMKRPQRTRSSSSRRTASRASVLREVRAAGWRSGPAGTSGRCPDTHATRHGRHEQVARVSGVDDIPLPDEPEEGTPHQHEIGAAELAELVIRAGGAVQARPDLLRMLPLGVDDLDQVLATDVAEGQTLREAMSQRLAARHGAARDEDRRQTSPYDDR